MNRQIGVNLTQAGYNKMVSNQQSGLNPGQDVALDADSHVITYDGVGNRKSDTYLGNRLIRGQVQVTYEYDPATQGFTIPVYTETLDRTTASVTENYTYDAQNRLVQVKRDDLKLASANTLYSDRLTVAQLSGVDFILEQRKYDAAGQVLEVTPGEAISTANIDRLYRAPGDTVTSSGLGDSRQRNIYDLNGRVRVQQIDSSQLQRTTDLIYEGVGSPAVAVGAVNEVSPNGQANGYDAAGNVLQYTVRDHRDPRQPLSTYRHAYVKRERMLQATTSGWVNGANNNELTRTVQTYDGNGNLRQVMNPSNPITSGNVGDAINRNFVTDINGTVLRAWQVGAKEQFQLVANGEVLGRYGQMAKANEPTAFEAKKEFNFVYTPVGSTFPALTPSTYVVNPGDTLQSIAKAVYGDAGQWYLIAEANGLADNSLLQVGRVLRIPSLAQGGANNDRSFKPYDPSQVVGNTSPLLPMPKPPKKSFWSSLREFDLGENLQWGVKGLTQPWRPEYVFSFPRTLPAATYFDQEMLDKRWLYKLGRQAATDGSAYFSAGIGWGGALWDGYYTWVQTGSVDKAAKVSAAGATGAVVSYYAGPVAGNIAQQSVAVELGVQDEFSWREVAATAATSGWNSGSSGGNFSWSQFATDYATNYASGVAYTAIANDSLSSVNWRQQGADAFGQAAANSTSRWATGRSQQEEELKQARRDSASEQEGFLSGYLRAMFGNALGNSIAGQIAQAGQQEARAQAIASRVNVSQFESNDPLGELIARNPQWTQETGGVSTTGGPTHAQQYALAAGKGPLNEQAANSWVIQNTDYRMHLQPAGADAGYIPLPPRPLAFKPILEMNPDTGRMGFYQGGDVWTFPVPESTVVSRPLATAGVVGASQQGDSPVWSTLKGLGFGALRIVGEPVLQIGDFIQVANEQGRSWLTGEAPRPINYLSGVGRMAAQGYTTTDIMGGGFHALMRTPDRVEDAINNRDYYALGEESSGFVLGGAAAMYGTRSPSAGPRPVANPKSLVVLNDGTLAESTIWSNKASGIYELPVIKNDFKGTDLSQHLSVGGPHGKTVFGAHRMDQFEAALQQIGAIETGSRVPLANGVYEVQYMTTAGKTGTKTVYDPAVLSDAQVLRMSNTASKEAWTTYTTTNQRMLNTTVENVPFRVLWSIDKKTGLPTVYSHPGR
jgi:LysM repeat protein